MCPAALQSCLRWIHLENQASHCTIWHLILQKTKLNNPFNLLTKVTHKCDLYLGSYESDVGFSGFPWDIFTIDSNILALKNDRMKILVLKEEKKERRRKRSSNSLTCQVTPPPLPLLSPAIPHLTHTHTHTHTHLLYFLSTFMNGVQSWWTGIWTYTVHTFLREFTTFRITDRRLRVGSARKSPSGQTRSWVADSTCR